MSAHVTTPTASRTATTYPSLRAAWVPLADHRRLHAVVE